MAISAPGMDILMGILEALPRIRVRRPSPRRVDPVVQQGTPATPSAETRGTRWSVSVAPGDPVSPHLRED